MGKICSILTAPVFSLVLGNHPDIINIVLYIISAVIMFSAVSFFSGREGYNDTHLLRFSPGRAILAYVISGIIFYSGILTLLYLFLDSYAAAFITEYFLTPYFLPEETEWVLLYNINENIKNLILSKWLNLLFPVFFCVVLNIIFYKKGRKKWIENQKKKIELAKQSNK